MIVLVGLPLLLAPLVFVPGLRRVALALAPWAPLPMLILAAAPSLGQTSVIQPWLLFEARLELDALARAFTLFTAPLWLLAGLYIRGYVEDSTNVPRLYFFHLLAMAGNLGLLVAADLASFYAFFTLMSLAGYGLVIHAGSEVARRAARIYMAFAVLGELLLFAGIILALAAADSLEIAAVAPAIARSPHAAWITALLLAGFGVKAGALLLHMWLPLAHAAAPTPASAVLSGAMIKAGLFGWLRLLPLGSAIPVFGTVVLVAGVGAVFYAVLLGLTQRDPKTILAYSSVSQMGVMTLAIGVALTEPAIVPVAVAAVTSFAVHHGLSKAALFLGVGVARRAASRRTTLAVMLVSLALALSIAGAPLSTGALAKKGLAGVLASAPGPWRELLPTLASLSSAATLVLLLRFVEQLWAEAGRGRSGARASAVVSWASMAALGLLGLWALPWIAAWPEVAGPGELIGHAALWSSTWPLALGLGVYAGARRLARRFALHSPNVPSGDLVVLLERGLAALRGAAQAGAAVFERCSLPEQARAAGTRMRRAVDEVIAYERLAGWTVGGMLVLLAILALVALASG